MSNRTQPNSIRKQDHLRIALEQDVQFKEVTTGLEKYRFVHQALPELDSASIDLSLELFGKRLRSPIVISAMTGGVAAACDINRNLARAAQETGVALGVGSQRAAIEDPALAFSYQVRDVAPDILLFANLGAVQLNYGYGVSQCRQAVEMIGADALVLHLNPLQEALQPEGNTDFSGLLARIERVCRELEVPVIVKEVGWGISETVARRLASAGVTGIDVAGAGGTSWSEVERHRAWSQRAHNIAASFADWGIPTAESVLAVRRAAPRAKVIASGGIRTGVDVAKAIALGADAAGIATPFLKAAAVSAEAVTEAVSEVAEGLRIAMFCVGAASLGHLKQVPLVKADAAEAKEG